MDASLYPFGPVFEDNHYPIRRQLADYCFWHYALPASTTAWAQEIKNYKDDVLARKPRANAPSKQKDTREHWRQFKSAMNQLATAATHCHQEGGQPTLLGYHSQAVTHAWSRVEAEVQWFRRAAGTRLAPSLPSVALLRQHVPDMLLMAYRAMDNVNDALIEETLRDFSAEEKLAFIQRSGQAPKEHRAVQRQIFELLQRQPWAKEAFRLLDTLESNPPLKFSADDAFYQRTQLLREMNQMAEHASVLPSALFNAPALAGADEATLHAYAQQSEPLAQAWQSLSERLKQLADMAPGRYEHDSENFHRQLAEIYAPLHGILLAQEAPMAEPAPLSASYVSQFPNMTTPPADDDTPALAIAEDAPAPNEPDPRRVKETLETLHYRREGLDAAQKLMLRHQIRAAIADIPLPERPLQAQQSWYTQLMNASKYRQEFMRSYENIPKPPSFQSTLVVKRQVEKALDQLAETVTETYQPGKTNPAIQQHFTALMDAIEQMVEKNPNAKAALGDANLRDALACVLYSAIEQGFENTAKLLIKGSHADQLQQARNQNGPSMRGH